MPGCRAIILASLSLYRSGDFSVCCSLSGASRPCGRLASTRRMAGVRPLSPYSPNRFRPSAAWYLLIAASAMASCSGVSPGCPERARPGMV